MKIFNFLRTHKMGLLSLLLVAFATALGADSSFAMAEVTPTGAEDGFSQEPVGGTKDTRGLETQYQGQGATAGEARQQGLEVEEIDQLVANFRPFRFPLEWFITNRMQQQSATSYEQSHYRSGATQLEAKVVNAASASVSGTFAKKNVAVTFPYDALEGAENIHEYDTIYVSEIAGYEDDGTTEEGGLLLFVVKADETNIKAMVINPPASGSIAFANEMKLVICGNACSESQMIVDPETYLPVKDTLYLQKKISNIVMTDDWIEQARKVKFITKDVVGNGIYNHKRKCARSHWLGRKYMTNVKVSDAKIGQEPVYFEKGILRQINMSYTHEGDAIQWNDLIALSQMQHTDNAANTNSVALCGKNAVRRLQELFLNNVDLQKAVAYERIDEIGVDLYKWHDAFGTIDFIHDPTLNDIGYEDFIVVLDMDNAVHYVKRMEKEVTQDLKTNGENREAERRIITTIDCVGLKGYNSILFGPATKANLITKLGIDFNATSAATLSETGKMGQVVYLTEDFEGFAKGTLVEWDGTAWKEYEGVIEG
jgi:hypothetical protein